MKIYIAGKFAARDRLVKHKKALQDMGYEVLSTWLTEESYSLESVARTAEQNRNMANRDVREVAMCDLFIIDTADNSNTGGRDVEYGIARGLEKRLIVIGQERNIFHYIAHARYYTWAECLQRFKNLQEGMNVSSEIVSQLSS